MNIDIYADDPSVTNEYILAVTEAFVKDKKPIQFWARNGENYKLGWRKFGPLVCLQWDWIHYIYRVDPASKPKKLVPLTDDDIPAVCWLRAPGTTGGFLLVTGLMPSGKGVVTTKGDPWTFDYLFKTDWEYSSDRKNWKPFSKEV